MATSDTPSVPVKPCSIARRVSCRIAFSLIAFRSLVKEGIVQLTAPMRFSRAHSGASSRL